MYPKSFIVGVLLLFYGLGINAQSVESKSVYQEKPVDPHALYFTPENFKMSGKADVSDELQAAVNQLKTERNFGVLFIPEGIYKISKTIFIPTAIRLIGYGKHRPVFVLTKNAPGFQQPDERDKGKSKYMFWFTHNMVTEGRNISDAGASTFYSAMSNINLKIEDGNPQAVALRTHYAQHSFIAHVDIQIGKGKAGMYDVGNEMEDVRFYGGEYGIYTTKASPGWQFMMTDTYFEGQRKAAIKTQEAGLTIVRMQVKNVPTVVQIDSNYHEKLFMEDCQFDQVSGAAIVISNEDNAFNQIVLRNVDCQNVKVLASFRRSNRKITGTDIVYKVKNFIYGLQMDDLDVDAAFKTTVDLLPLKRLPQLVKKDIPDLPAMQTWVNLKDLGAKGDGVTDDTKIIQDAIDKYHTIYIPQGWYKVSETIRFKEKTVLIGFSPIATQFFLADYTPAFAGFGGPKALIESAKGGQNILTGIGLNTGGFNNRAVACKWMSGAGSLMNDVKFIGGHGGMNSKAIGYAINSSAQGSNAWDTQYWSLWITNGGGGVFKNIWTASTYATSGIYVSDTSTPSSIYAMSVEHHVRNEVRFKNVANWKVYAMQLEEESKESADAIPLELENCKNLVFANLYMFRVIRVNTPAAYAIRTWSCKQIEFLNVHNYSQTKYTATLSLYDINTSTEVRPWEFTRLFISGKEEKKESFKSGVQLLVKGFEYADGICKDNKGNVFFSETRQRRIYKWSDETKTLSMVADFPWEPLSLACDQDNNLLVVFKYIPRPGYLIDGQPESFPLAADAHGTSFSGWGNSGFGVLVYAINPEQPEESIQLLKKEKMGSIAAIQKALYPSNRWRDFHDFNQVTVNKPEEMFVAPDRATIIPIVYDLARSTALTVAYPGKTVYAIDEYDKRAVSLDVNAVGYLSNLKYFAEKGEYNSATAANGDVYIADGQIYVFDAAGKAKRQIKTPERPVNLIFGGKDGKTLFMTSRTAFYSIEIH